MRNFKKRRPGFVELPFSSPAKGDTFLHRRSHKTVAGASCPRSSTYFAPSPGEPSSVRAGILRQADSPHRRSKNPRAYAAGLASKKMAFRPKGPAGRIAQPIGLGVGSPRIIPGLKGRAFDRFATDFLSLTEIFHRTAPSKCSNPSIPRNDGLSSSRQEFDEIGEIEYSSQRKPILSGWVVQ